ncbi:MAG: hypothetical protein PHT84_02560 [Candidatus Pacebacteria bacterium]|nr:hypothetical protein [Candidatus Paceibacterota bacterium]
MDLEFINTFMAGGALIMSGFIIIRDYLLPAKIKLFYGDSLQIVCMDRNKIQINTNLTNSRNKLSVINRLEAILKSPNGNQYRYVWNIFYKLEGGRSVLERIPTSIAVLAKSSVFQGIEFIADDRFTWVEGKYEFKIIGWENRGISQKNNLSSAKIIFSLNKDDIDNLTNHIIETTGVIPMRKVRIIN